MEISAGYYKRDIVGCFGLTEPEAGSTRRHTHNRAQEGSEWILNGTKTFITNGPIADVALIMALTTRPRGPVPALPHFGGQGRARLSVGKALTNWGSGFSYVRTRSGRLRVPESAVLGDMGHGFIQAMQTLEFGRIGMATVALGIAMACMDEANKYSKERKAFGKPINRDQEISFKLADMMIMTDISRLLIYRAAWAKEAKDPESAVIASCAKLFASESATQIASMAVQVYGGYGYIKDFAVERLYRDAKLGEIGEGTSEIQRVLIAKSILARFKK